LAIIRDEDKYKKKKEDVIYKKVWRINERKQGQVNKEQVQEIMILGIIDQEQSRGRKGEFKFQRDDDSTYEEEYYSASKHVLF
jgi:hypothetical protein